MTRAESGRLGGVATYQKHGRWHYVALGQAGAQATIARHGLGYFRGLPNVKRWAPRRDTLAADLAAGAWLSEAA
jgi:hypothetical protein